MICLLDIPNWFVCYHISIGRHKFTKLTTLTTNFTPYGRNGKNSKPKVSMTIGMFFS